uniref:Probable ATP-dependent RNA helicase DDX52 n=1 Tax=Clastoptera arizonana TaxID=38151 RepID=A0A1B6CLU8_9HEMI
MDADDIFRKLTVGALPKYLKLPTNTKNLKSSLDSPQLNGYNTIKSVQKVKKEKSNQILTKVKHELPDKEELTLLGDIKSGQERKESIHKPKKIKTEKTKRQLAAEHKVEKINQLRNAHKITVVGGNVPAPVETFDQFVEEYKVSSKIISNLKSSGYENPTPIQMQAIPVMLQNRQILACAPTGSGKTAAFIVPILHSLGSPKNEGFRALIVCPTRELARQIYRETSWLAEGTGLKTHIISKVKQSADKFGSKFTTKFDILITTPNRIIYLLRQENVTFSLKTVEWLIIDESDKLFEVGVRGFRDQLAEIYKACDATNIKRAMFSATHTVHVTKWCRKNLKDLITVIIGHRNTAVNLVQQELIFVGSEHGKLIEFRNLVHQGLPPPVLVFVQSKERAKELFNELIYDGINVDVIHADRTQLQRDNVVKAFREGKVWVLICTELMGRGIDFKGVNLVINYDFPNSAISYIHRIGRTGRAGRRGRAVTFFTESDRPALRSIATVMRDSGCEVPEYMLNLKKTSKREKRKLEHTAPNRKPISTTPSYTKFKNNKLKKRIDATKKQKEANKNKISKNE